MTTTLFTVGTPTPTDGSTLAASQRTSGGNTLFDIVSTPGTPVTPSDGLFVAPSGSDSTGDGSFATPYKTLSKGVLTLRGNSLRKLYVKAGTYTLGSTLTLTSSDSGITIKNNPGDTPVVNGSINTLIKLNGCSSVTVQGLTFTGATTASPPAQAAMVLDGASNNHIIANWFHDNDQHILLENSANSNQISGNQMDDADASAIELKDDANSNTIDSNIIDGTGSLNTTGGGVFGHGVLNTVVTHNWIKNTAGISIGFEAWDNTTTCTGTQIKFNICKASNNTAATNDSGAIYLLGRDLTPVATLIDHNYISFPTPNPGTSIIGLYLDDNVAGATVTNNIVRNAVTHAAQIHGGGNNTIRNNVFDFASTTVSGILYQYRAADDGVTAQNMIGNVVDKNIFVSSQTHSVSGGVPRAWSNLISPASGRPSITNNWFMDGTLGSAQWEQGGLTQSGDHYGDVQFNNRAAGDYTLKSSSPALTAGVASINTAGMGPQPSTATWYAPVGALSTMI